MPEKRQCVFCEGKSLSKEHIFAQWLLKELEIYDKNVSMTHASVIGVPISNRNHAFSKLINGLVCEKCNNGWMSQLEGDCKKHIINLMNMEELKSELEFLNDNYYTVAKWAFKNVILLNSATNYRQLAPESHYKKLYNGEIPPNTFVDLSFCSNDSVIEWRQSPGNFVIKDKNIPLNPNTDRYIITFKIKHLMIKVAYYKSDYNVFYEDEGSIRLYPQFGIYGEPKIFDSIDSFDINGLFNEYIT
ncbi:hypothetical protein AAT22_18230 [Clostridium sp. C8]|nr:hypothetical protein AAT22_18230 [Clostridium sp. C8]